MRLNRIKLAGFKSFVDPTAIHLPGNLTGIVGPNGCGKSNIIDAVRWVMGELSARQLRGDSMVDVIFNGSSARKPIGAASVELMFDNSDGKVGGAYANYSEISLKRLIERDGTSTYFINGGRCRRKDITQLFLGTGLGSRSYAIIEQDMISRIIDARAEDMRAFVEEAAGVSLYKERRRETESRIADTRENLSRVSDLRDEIDKQIRHLQRQANTARRYQQLRDQERTLSAESLALRVRELDRVAAGQDESMRERELAMQQALAEQRAAEGGIEKQRERYAELSEALSGVQGRYYQLGAEVTRAEEGIRYSRERRERALHEGAQIEHALAAVDQQIEHDERALAGLRAELAELSPQLQARREQELQALQGLSAAEAALGAWQQRWEAFAHELGAVRQSAQVEAARIEQLENQRDRLQLQSGRLAHEQEQLSGAESESELERLQAEERLAGALAEQRAAQLARALEQLQQLRSAQQLTEGRLERLRQERESLRSELLSLEALQRAALREKNAKAGAWLAALSATAGQPRLAETLEVSAGWERAVETVLGDYLEAVGVATFDEVQEALPRLEGGYVGFFERPAGAAAEGVCGAAGTLAEQVRGPEALRALLERVRTAESLAAALRERTRLAEGESVITASGEWLGRSWLRVNRGGEAHAGVIEREQRLKGLRERNGAADQRVRVLEQELTALRAQLTGAERHGDGAQAEVQSAHREHAELRGRLEALKVRVEQAVLRRARIAAAASEMALDAASTEQGLSTARSAHQTALSSLTQLESSQHGLEQERERLRAEANVARERLQVTQLALRDTLIRLESRRSGQDSALSALARLQQQRGALQDKRVELDGTLAEADAPLAALERGLQQHLAARLEVEGELTSARRRLEESDLQLRALDQQRQAAEQRVAEARAAMEQARLAAQESRLRREALLEQFAATHCTLEAVLAQLSPEAQVGPWDERLEALRADIERLGQVNLAAIGELSEQSERKAYLDSQYNDVNEALQTLEQAMRKIDRETRARFDDTFRRINDGLQEKFPRLFGGGHAYLELVGDDPLSAGVAVMARPPGKRNSVISQLSGGEKALTAVALVFSIFDLNPAPFCLLDEVDAPLDEHNVSRFCDIVQEMSRRVQFIFITHNKITMELASQLIGVTMNEPGVSRLVTVDLDDAVKLAAV